MKLCRSLFWLPTVRKFIVLNILVFLILAALYFFIFDWDHTKSHVKNLVAGDIVDFTHANNVTGYSHFIVPNIVHYVHFGSQEINFIQAVSIRAVYLNHNPDKIVIHCDCTSLNGRYWDIVKNISSLEIRFMQCPTHVFGKPLSSIYHASDIARLKVLMKYGGIFLDGDTYVVKSLNPYRKFEMALGWPPGYNMGTQTLVAHKNARFLKLWYNSYRYYRRERWYYNAGELPTSVILEPNPGLVHRVPYDFGVHDVVQMLYGSRSKDWKNFVTIHLLIRHKNYLLPGDYVVSFDEKNIKSYNKTFGDMARLVIYGSEDLILT